MATNKSTERNNLIFIAKLPFSCFCTSRNRLLYFVITAAIRRREPDTAEPVRGARLVGPAPDSIPLRSNSFRWSTLGDNSRRHADKAPARVDRIVAPLASGGPAVHETRGFCEKRQASPKLVRARSERFAGRRTRLLATARGRASVQSEVLRLGRLAD